MEFCENSQFYHCGQNSDLHNMAEIENVEMYHLLAEGVSLKIR